LIYNCHESVNKTEYEITWSISWLESPPEDIHHHKSRLSALGFNKNTLNCKVYFAFIIENQKVIRFLLLGVHEDGRRVNHYICIPSTFYLHGHSSKSVSIFFPTAGVPTCMSCRRSEHRSWRTPRNYSSSSEMWMR